MFKVHSPSLIIKIVPSFRAAFRLSQSSRKLGMVTGQEEEDDHNPASVNPAGVSPGPSNFQIQITETKPHQDPQHLEDLSSLGPTSLWHPGTAVPATHGQLPGGPNTSSAMTSADALPVMGEASFATLTNSLSTVSSETNQHIQLLSGMHAKFRPPLLCSNSVRSQLCSNTGHTQPCSNSGGNQDLPGDNQDLPPYPILCSIPGHFQPCRYSSANPDLPDGNQDLPPTPSLLLSRDREPYLTPCIIYLLLGLRGFPIPILSSPGLS
jgi:hypothetical protein